MLILHQFLKNVIRRTVTYCRSISTFSNFSKVFEILIYTQVNSFLESELSKCLADFLKNHNTSNAFLKIIELWCSVLNKGDKVKAVAMDLSKAFDRLNRRLILREL